MGKRLKKISKRISKSYPKATKFAKKVAPKVKAGYSIARTTVRVVKKEIGIKPKKKGKKKRFISAEEFNRRLLS